jgi:hypothetical protein
MAPEDENRRFDNITTNRAGGPVQAPTTIEPKLARQTCKSIYPATRCFQMAHDSGAR